MLQQTCIIQQHIPFFPENFCTTDLKENSGLPFIMRFETLSLVGLGMGLTTVRRLLMIARTPFLKSCD